MTLKSTAAPWLNHQKSLAERKDRPRSARQPGGRHVDRLGLEQAIGLLPEPDLARLAEEPAVADDAVVFGRLAGQQARLGGAGDGRHHFLQRADPAGCGQRLESRAPGAAGAGQSDGVKHDKRLNIHLATKRSAHPVEFSPRITGQATRKRMKEPPVISLPPYTYVPGASGRTRRALRQGTCLVLCTSPAESIEDGRWEASAALPRGVELFNAGYYWEAHEAWEPLWHAHGRRGVIADVLRALIKLAAAGVKVLEGRPDGVRTHASRAAALFAQAREEAGSCLLGLNLDEWVDRASSLANSPPPVQSPAQYPCQARISLPA